MSTKTKKIPKSENYFIDIEYRKEDMKTSNGKRTNINASKKDGIDSERGRNLDDDKTNGDREFSALTHSPKSLEVVNLKESKLGPKRSFISNLDNSGYLPESKSISERREINIDEIICYARLSGRSEEVRTKIGEYQKKGGNIKMFINYFVDFSMEKGCSTSDFVLSSLIANIISRPSKSDQKCMDKMISEHEEKFLFPDYMTDYFKHWTNTEPKLIITFQCRSCSIIDRRRNDNIKTRGLKCKKCEGNGKTSPEITPKKEEKQEKSNSRIKEVRDSYYSSLKEISRIKEEMSNMDQKSENRSKILMERIRTIERENDSLKLECEIGCNRAIRKFAIEEMENDENEKRRLKRLEEEEEENRKGAEFINSCNKSKSDFEERQNKSFLAEVEEMKIMGYSEYRKLVELRDQFFKILKDMDANIIHLNREEKRKEAENILKMRREFFGIPLDSYLIKCYRDDCECSKIEGTDFLEREKLIDSCSYINSVSTVLERFFGEDYCSTVTIKKLKSHLWRPDFELENSDEIYFRSVFPAHGKIDIIPDFIREEIEIEEKALAEKRRLLEEKEKRKREEKERLRILRKEEKERLREEKDRLKILNLIQEARFLSDRV